MNQSNPFRAQEEQELTPSSHASSNVSSEWNVVYSDYLRKTEVCQAYFCPLYLYKYTSSSKTHEHSYSTIMFLLVLPGQVRREVISSHQHGDLIQQNTFSTWYKAPFFPSSLQKQGITIHSSLVWNLEFFHLSLLSAGITVHANMPSFNATSRCSILSTIISELWCILCDTLLCSLFPQLSRPVILRFSIEHIQARTQFTSFLTPPCPFT